MKSADAPSAGGNPQETDDADPSHPAARLRQVIEHAAHYLPAQGPITVFIHHNTLHAFESLPFEEGVQRGAELFGCEPFLTEERYRQEFARGRIHDRDLVAVLHDDLAHRGPERIARLISRFDLRLAMLRHPLRHAPPAELRWFVAETDALTRIRADVPAATRDRLLAETRHWVMRDLLDGANSARHATEAATRIEGSDPSDLQAVLDRFGRSSIEQWSKAKWEAFYLQSLYRLCLAGAQCGQKQPASSPSPVRHRDVLLALTGEDSDALVHDVLIRLCAAFLDQGLTHWPLPRRDEGLYRAFCSLYRTSAGPPNRWLRGLSQELARIQDEHIEPSQSIFDSLQALGVNEGEWDEYLSATLLALRGWAGMVHQAETRTDRLVHPAPPGSLLEFVAVRLILERFAVAHVARTAWGFTVPLHDVRRMAAAATTTKTGDYERRAFTVFQLAQVCGWTPSDLHRLSDTAWANWLAEIEAFSNVERRRVFHLAYERRYRQQSLDAIAVRVSRGERPRPKPKFQVVCCLDEREESFRRHVEEIAPEAETFGAAGFFSVAMYYRGAADAHFVPLCPIIMQPRHWVTEEVATHHQREYGQRQKRRWLLGAAAHSLHVGSRSFTLGALLAAGFGVLASLPLVARVLFPRAAAMLRRRARRLVDTPKLTSLRLERTDPSPGKEISRIGLNLDEMTGIVERLLRDLGLTRNFARLVFILGHGSSSLNNPHESAYHCGACGGARGDPTRGPSPS